MALSSNVVWNLCNNMSWVGLGGQNWCCGWLWYFPFGKYTLWFAV